jgi:hypothetical protein
MLKSRRLAIERVRMRPEFFDGARALIAEPHAIARRYAAATPKAKLSSVDTVEGRPERSNHILGYSRAEAPQSRK